MKIGIVGTGNIGGTLAKLLVEAGHEVVLSFSRSEEKLRALADTLGHQASTGTPSDAVAFGEVVIFSIHYAVLSEALAQLGDAAGKVLIDTGNPVDISLPQGVSGAQEMAQRLPKAHLVKAFNTLYYKTLLSEAHADPPLVMPLCGDDAGAKERVARLIREVGFVPLDLGGLEEAVKQESGGLFFNQSLTKVQAQALMREA